MKKRKINCVYGEIKGRNFKEDWTNLILYITTASFMLNKNMKNVRTANFNFLLYTVASLSGAPSPVKAVSVLMAGNLRVISCLCLWMIRCSSNWKRCSTSTEWERNKEMHTAGWQYTWDELFSLISWCLLQLIRHNHLCQGYLKIFNTPVDK